MESKVFRGLAGSHGLEYLKELKDYYIENEKWNLEEPNLANLVEGEYDFILSGMKEFIGFLQPRFPSRVRLFVKEVIHLREEFYLAFVYDTLDDNLPLAAPFIFKRSIGGEGFILFRNGIAYFNMDLDKFSLSVKKSEESLSNKLASLSLFDEYCKYTKLRFEDELYSPCPRLSQRYSDYPIIRKGDEHFGVGFMTVERKENRLVFLNTVGELSLIVEDLYCDEKDNIYLVSEKERKQYKVFDSGSSYYVWICGNMYYLAMQQYFDILGGRLEPKIS